MRVGISFCENKLQNFCSDVFFGTWLPMIQKCSIIPSDISETDKKLNNYNRLIQNTVCIDALLDITTNEYATYKHEAVARDTDKEAG